MTRTKIEWPEYLCFCESQRKRYEDKGGDPYVRHVNEIELAALGQSWVYRRKWVETKHQETIQSPTWEFVTRRVEEIHITYPKIPFAGWRKESDLSGYEKRLGMIGEWVTCPTFNSQLSELALSDEEKDVAMRILFQEVGSCDVDILINTGAAVLLPISFHDRRCWNLSQPVAHINRFLGLE